MRQSGGVSRHLNGTISCQPPRQFFFGGSSDPANIIHWGTVSMPTHMGNILLHRRRITPRITFQLGIMGCGFFFLTKQPGASPHSPNILFHSLYHLLYITFHPPLELSHAYTGGLPPVKVSNHPHRSLRLLYPPSLSQVGLSSK